MKLDGLAFGRFNEAAAFVAAESRRALPGLEPAQAARLSSFTVTPVRLSVLPMIKLEQRLSYGHERSKGQCDVGHVFDHR